MATHLQLKLYFNNTGDCGCLWSTMLRSFIPFCTNLFT